MKIDVPMLNEDGSVQYTQTLSAEEVQVLLQFALNFLTTIGMTSHQLVKLRDDDEPAPFND